MEKEAVFDDIKLSDDEIYYPDEPYCSEKNEEGEGASNVVFFKRGASDRKGSSWD